jgi:hypothetical protein
MNPRKCLHSLAASESSLSKRPAQAANGAAQEQETDKEEEALKQNGNAEEVENGVEGLILDGVVAEDVGVKGVKMVDPLSPAPHKAEKVKYLYAMKFVALSITSEEWATVTSEGAEKMVVAKSFQTVQDRANEQQLQGKRPLN